MTNFDNGSGMFEDKVQEYAQQYAEADLAAAQQQEAAAKELEKNHAIAEGTLRKLGFEASKALLAEGIPQLPVFKAHWNNRKPDRSYASKIGNMWVVGMVGVGTDGTLYRQPQVKMIRESHYSLLPRFTRKIIEVDRKRLLVNDFGYKHGDKVVLGIMDELRMSSWWSLPGNRYAEGVVTADETGKPIVAITDREYGPQGPLDLESGIIHSVARVIADHRHAHS